MSVLLVKILLFKTTDPLVGINVTDFIDITGTRGLDIKNNLLSFTLKNSQVELLSSGETLYSALSNSLEVNFEEDDTIKLYLHYSDDFAEIEDSIWDDNASDPGSSFLRGVYSVTELGIDETISNNVIKITCADKTFIIFNRLVAKGFPKKATTGSTSSTLANSLVDSGAKFLQTANVGMRVLNTTDVTVSRINSIDSDTQLTLEDDIFTSSENYELQWTAPAIMQKIIRFSSQSSDGEFDGSGADSGVSYQIDAKLNEEGGFIQDTRKATHEDGTANTDTVFPGVSLSKVWKPVYEWLDELSQLEFLNSTDELNNTNGKKIVYGRNFYFWVDENNKFHWVETTDTVDTTITVGSTANILKFALKKSLFDVINFIVFRGGEDFFGKGTLDYFIDSSASTKIKKMHVVAMIDIARELIEKEISLGNLVEASDGVFTFQGVNYNRNGTVTADWDGVDYSNDDVYNTAVRTEILKRGKNRARSIITGRANARWKGPLEFRGQLFTQGDLLQITNKKLGLNNEKIRIQDVQDIINKEGWFTTLQLEQDDKVLISLTG